MSAPDHYKTAASFRTALEQRRRAEALTSGIALNRLRKEAAFNRLLARLHRAAPDRWALKGGLAMIARLGAQVRGTKDADANWRAARSDLVSMVEDLDLNDWFGFTVGDARLLQGEGEEGALRHPVSATLAGRVFEHLSLDVNFLDPEDARPVELVVVRRNPFEFVNEPSLEIPMVTPGQQLAEKLHAYARIYDRLGSTVDRVHRRLSAAMGHLGRCVCRPSAVLGTHPDRNRDLRCQLAARSLAVELTFRPDRISDTTAGSVQSSVSTVPARARWLLDDLTPAADTYR